MVVRSRLGVLLAAMLLAGGAACDTPTGAGAPVVEASFNEAAPLPGTTTPSEPAGSAVEVGIEDGELVGYVGGQLADGQVRYREPQFVAVDSVINGVTYHHMLVYGFEGQLVYHIIVDSSTGLMKVFHVLPDGTVEWEYWDVPIRYPLEIPAPAAPSTPGPVPPGTTAPGTTSPGTSPGTTSPGTTSPGTGGTSIGEL